MKLKPRSVKAALALKGKTLRSWAHERGFCDKTVYAVLNGTRSGRRSPAVVQALEGLRCA